MLEVRLANTSKADEFNVQGGRVGLDSR